MDQLESLGTVKDAALACRVSAKTFYTLAQRGVIPADCIVRLSRRMRVDMRRLREFLAAGGTAKRPAASAERRPGA